MPGRGQEGEAGRIGCSRRGASFRPLPRGFAGGRRLLDLPVPTVPSRCSFRVNRAKRKDAGAPQPLGELMGRFLDRSGLTPKLEAAAAALDWPALVGPQIAAVTEALRVSEGTLFVAVASSAWMNELNMMRAELMRRINAGRREGRIRALVFVMGEGVPRGSG